MERYFEKISFKQFKKDISDNKKEYADYKLPCRATKTSVGYDFFSIKKIIIKPGEIVKIATGYKAKFNENEALLMVIRSSMGFKHNVRLCNQIGVVESDYYNNPSNEGHLFIALQNEGKEDYIINKGDAYAQGIFINVLTCNDIVDTKRIGGIGSTD